MRWLILAVVLSLGFAGYVVVAAVTSAPAGEPEFESHLPETGEEQAVARGLARLVRARVII